MAASPSSVLTLGLGSWGSSSLVVTLGFGSAEIVAATIPGLEFTARGRLHWTIDVGLTHYTAQGRVHYTIPEEDA